MQSISLTIADDHILFTETLSAALQCHPKLSLDVLDVVHSGNSLLNALSVRVPDVLLLDLNMPDGDGLSVLPVIRKKHRQVRVIALTMYDEPKFIKQVLQSGAYGYLLKTSGLEELVHGIHMAMNNKTYLSEGLKVFPKDNDIDADDLYKDDFQYRHKLTKREKEILLLISQAKSNKEIADELFISDQTVGVHRKNIMRKLSISNTAGLIKFAMDNIQS